MAWHEAHTYLVSDKKGPSLEFQIDSLPLSLFFLSLLLMDTHISRSSRVCTHLKVPMKLVISRGWTHEKIPYL
jgi:hypothetical protein